MLNPLFKSPENKTGALGEELFDECSSFFAWYEWVRQASDPSEGIRDLLTIMLVAQYQTLNAEQEKKALSKMRDIRERLNDGTMRFDQIPRELEKALDNLIDASPRNHLIALAMKVEIAMRAKKTTPSDELVILMEEMMARVRNYMPTIQAEAICHRLEKFLETSLTEKDIEDLKNHLWTLIQ